MTARLRSATASSPPTRPTAQRADGAAVRNVEVLVRDNDVPGVTIIQVTPGTDAEDRTTLVLEDDAAGIADEILVSLSSPASGVVQIRLDLPDGQLRLVRGDALDSRFNEATRVITFQAGDTTPVRIRILIDDVDPEDAAFARLIATLVSGPAAYTFPDVRLGVDVRRRLGGRHRHAERRVHDGRARRPRRRLHHPPDHAAHRSVDVAILTDGLTDAALGGRVTMKPIGTATAGLFSGAVVIDSALRRITRTDGGSFLAAGFLEDSASRSTGGTTYFKIVIRGTNATFDDVLELTPSTRSRCSPAS